jgi:NDP-sugar pyrophosphorylase family protein
MLHIIVPLGGKAARFQERGFTFPKPLIEIGNRSMIEMVLKNLAPPQPCQYTFICRKEHLTQFYLGDMLRILAPNCRIIPLEHDTAGALCSVLLAVDLMKPDEELLVANGDQFINSSLDPFYQACRGKGVDGCILTFGATHPRWSFVRTNPAGDVTAVAEKRPISKQATAGLYYFRRSSDFLAASEKMLVKGLTTAGQYFIAPVYNELILVGKRATTCHLPDETMYSLGTPEDVELFLRNTPRNTLADHNLVTKQDTPRLGGKKLKP